MISSKSISLFWGRVWLVTWMAVFPLFHIHPEADHAHGAQHHIHGGIYHSVLEKDLSCEYQIPLDHHSSPSQIRSVWSLNSLHPSFHVFDHAEISFSSLGKGVDDLWGNPPPSQPLVVDGGQDVHLTGSIIEFFPTGSSPPFGLLVSHHRIRPPPFRLF